AWERPDFRHFPDFSRYIQANPDLACGDALPYHATALGTVNSLLYDTFGHQHLRFLVRLINRKDPPALPLNYTHRDYLRGACEYLEEYTNDYANQIIIRQVEKLSSSAL